MDHSVRREHGYYLTLQMIDLAGFAKDVRGDPDADRPAAGTARAGVDGRSGQMRVDDDGRDSP